MSGARDREAVDRERLREVGTAVLNAMRERRKLKTVAVAANKLASPTRAQAICNEQIATTKAIAALDALVEAAQHVLDEDLLDLTDAERSLLAKYVHDMRGGAEALAGIEDSEIRYSWGDEVIG